MQYLTNFMFCIDIVLGNVSKVSIFTEVNGIKLI